MKQQKLNTVQLQHINTPQACPEVPESMSRILAHLLHYVELSPADFTTDTNIVLFSLYFVKFISYHNMFQL